MLNIHVKKLLTMILALAVWFECVVKEVIRELEPENRLTKGVCLVGRPTCQVPLTTQSFSLVSGVG